MTKQKKKEQLIDLGRSESEIFEPTEEVRNEFEEAASSVVTRAPSAPRFAGGRGQA